MMPQPVCDVECRNPTAYGFMEVRVDTLADSASPTSELGSQEHKSCSKFIVT